MPKMPPNNEVKTKKKFRFSKELILLISGILIIVFCVLFDQITKSAAMNNLNEGTIVPFIPHFIEWDLVFNKGAAWGLGEDATWSRILLIIISWAVVIGFIIYAIYLKLKKKEFKFGLWIIFAFIIGGDIGNLIDRTFFYDRGVVDFISIQSWWNGFGIFNVADSILVCSLFALIIYFVVELILERNRKNKEIDEKIKTQEENDNK